MSIGENLSEYAGRTVIEFKRGLKFDRKAVYRLTQDYDDERPQAEVLNEFLDAVPLDQLDALIIGNWNESYETGPTELLQTLIARREQLAALRSLFVGDITFEENEISWIIQGAYKPLLDSFQTLESLRVRGSTRLSIEPFEHHHLHELAIECGGLPSELVQNLRKSRMPALRRLELWLGSDGYGYDCELADFEELLESIDGSRLEYLGLRNAPIADELAQWLAGQSWIGHLHTLDLSMGTLGDIGAKALLDSPFVRELKRLNLSHHYISERLQARLRALPIEVVLDDPQEEDDGERYVEVSE